MGTPIDVYARVSSRGDREQKSISGQIGACRAVLAERGLPEGEVHVDDGRSAWRQVPRPGWDRLMARLENGQSGGVIVFDLERFARRMRDGVRLAEAAKRGLLVLDSDGEYDLSTASGEKAFHDAISAATYYSHRLSDRVKRGKRAKALSGQADRRRCFGFEDDGITVRDDEAQWIRWAAEHILHGDAQPAVVARMNARGITTIAGVPWTQRSLRDILLRDRIAGRLAYNGVVVAQLPGSPILDKATHDRIVAKYAGRRRGRPNSPAYLCSGIALCGLCGRRLAGRPRASKRPYPDGAVRREYWCPPVNGGCGRVFVDQRALDEAAAELAKAVLSDPRHASSIEAEVAAVDEEAAALDSLIAKDEELARTIGGRLGRGEITLERHDAIMGPLDERLASLQAHRQALGSRERSHGTGDVAREWDAGLPEERRSLLRTALRGRSLIVGPADPADRASVSRRLTLR